MSAVKKIFNVLSWIITILFQVASGQIAGRIAITIGQGKVLESIIFLWIGIAVGVFLIGALAILLRRSIYPKKYLSRLGLTSLGVLIPIAILVAVGLSQGFYSEIFNNGLGLMLKRLAYIFGMIGFYIPGWIKSK